METGSKEKKHSIVIEDRRRAELTGIDEVVSSDSTAVAAVTAELLIVVRGENLAMSSFDVKNGRLEITGLVVSFEYAKRRGGKGSSVLSKLLR